MMHGQIVLGLYITLINLNPMAHMEWTKQNKEKERGAQAIITTPLRRHQEGYK
jgi:hypothetical protein